ncbi:S41 family peptidase [Ferrimonas aestuarii]|uniref:Peptidase S41 n=1 Tax=Ferrimonas aestuarii TaxID=2569539 RepID=A0A4U1BQZ2_9GAMM|nr:S41 family peptidase [Ferrimonas aestuarii]TKB55334.1 peptidase S41 [Ferrimonas aestuarii]
MKYLTTFLRLLVVVVAFATPQFSVAKELSREQKLYGLAQFWKEVSYNFAYFDQVPELDWDQQYLHFIEVVANTENDHEYYRQMLRFAALLQDGMTHITPPAPLLEQYVGWAPIQLSEHNRKAVVTAVAESLQQQLPTGAVITQVNAMAVDEFLAKQVFPFISSSTEQILWDKGIRGSRKTGVGLLAGPVGATLEITAVTAEGETVKVSTQYLSSSEAPTMVGQANPRRSANFEYKALADNLGYVRIGTFADTKVVTQFREVLPQLQQHQGLVLDIRHNGGGNTFIAEEILKHLSFVNLIGAKSKMRVHNSTYKAWGRFASEYAWAEKYLSYFNGDAWVESEPNLLEVDDVDIADKLVVPTVVLIGKNTAKAAEDFLIYLDDVSHVKTLGQPTYGSTGQPLIFDLPGGGSAKVCTKRETYADGRDFVGFGIQPDRFISQNISDIVDGEDVVLMEATSLLNQQLHVSKSAFVQ